MAEAEVKTFWQRQRLAEAEVENPHQKGMFRLFLARKFTLRRQFEDDKICVVHSYQPI